MQQYIYELTFSCNNVSEETYKLFELGISGIQEISNTLFKVFVTKEDEFELLIKNAKKLGFLLVNNKKIKNENWIIKCPSELETLEVDNLEIIPTIENENHELILAHDLKADKIKLKIIPGAGFGTGHHETTKNVLKFLQHDEIKNDVSKNNIKNALDIGTGSAILAIAANLLYNIPVVAFDNDAMAILNAAENIRLNSCSDNISLFCGEISDVNGKFDLILANIYAEILLDIHENILNSCTKNTFLLLSGIQEIKSDKIISKYSENFNIIAKLSENGWTTILLKIK